MVSFWDFPQIYLCFLDHEISLFLAWILDVNLIEIAGIGWEIRNVGIESMFLKNNKLKWNMVPAESI